MKKYFSNTFFLVFFISLLNISKAQNSAPKNGERVEAMRVAFITEKLNLTSEEAQKFWPVYNQFKNEMKTLRKNSKVSDAPLSGDEQLEFEQRKLDLKKKYKLQFDGVLGKEKASKLLSLEEEFKRTLVKNMQDRSTAPANRN